MILKGKLAVIGENVQIGEHVTIGDFVLIEDDVIIGDYARIEPFTHVTQHILPFTVVKGAPAMWYNLNKKALEEEGARTIDLDKIKLFYNTYYKSGKINELDYVGMGVYLIGIIDKFFKQIEGVEYLMAYGGEVHMIGDGESYELVM